ncbi:MAG: septum formation initiator family protein [bacterium]
MKKNRLLLSLLIIGGVLCILYAVGNTVYENYQIQQGILGLKNDITNMAQANKDLSAEILYYQSPSYQERIAREKLNLQKPGEKVIVILPEAKAKVVKEDPYVKLTNPQKWWLFFFKV